MAEDLNVPFSIREEKIEKDSPYWNYARVTILDDGGREIGGYERNYPGYAASTFHPFFLHDRWWALYSKDYTATRVMALPECEDWCGEERDPVGFCPVDYYVPRVRLATKETEYGLHQVYLDEAHPNDFALNYFPDIGPVEYAPIGFVAGCIWGDDSSWKIQFLDLRKLPEKLLIRDERFGYIELLGDHSLKDTIDLANWCPDDPIIGIRGQRWYNFETGEPDR